MYPDPLRPRAAKGNPQAAEVDVAAEIRISSHRRAQLRTFHRPLTSGTADCIPLQIPPTLPSTSDFGVVIPPRDETTHFASIPSRFRRRGWLAGRICRLKTGHCFSRTVLSSSTRREHGPTGIYVVGQSGIAVRTTCVCRYLQPIPIVGPEPIEVGCGGCGFDPAIRLRPPGHSRSFAEHRSGTVDAAYERMWRAGAGLLLAGTSPSFATGAPSSMRLLCLAHFFCSPPRHLPRMYHLHAPPHPHPHEVHSYIRGFLTCTAHLCQLHICQPPASTGHSARKAGAPAHDWSCSYVFALAGHSAVWSIAWYLHTYMLILPVASTNDHGPPFVRLAQRRRLLDAARNQAESSSCFARSTRRCVRVAIASEAHAGARIPATACGFVPRDRCRDECAVLGYISLLRTVTDDDSLIACDLIRWWRYYVRSTVRPRP